MKLNSILLLSLLSCSILCLDMQLLNFIKEHQEKQYEVSTENLYPFFRSMSKPSDYKAGENKLENCPDSYIQNLCQGYPFESHEVETEDGYILRVFRMQAQGTTIKNGLPPVFLQHGITASASAFLSNDDDKSLAKILANSGFDVWLGNTRGNKFSRKHKTLDIHKKEFWEFSFMQMGQFDVPANLQYIANTTGRKDIVYVGHSQGTTQMFAALSDPEVRPKVTPNLKAFYALAPVVYLKNNRIPIMNLGKYLEGFVGSFMHLFGVNHMEDGNCKYDQKEIDHWDEVCKKDINKCKNAYHMSDEYWEVENFDRYGYDHCLAPSGISTDSVIHFAQELKGDSKIPVFRKFDYGKKLNEEHYGQATPPDYDLSQIKENIHLWYGTGDKLADDVDVELMSTKLVNANVSMNKLDKWGHSTFNIGKYNREAFLQMVNEIKTMYFKSDFKNKTKEIAFE